MCVSCSVCVCVSVQRDVSGEKGAVVRELLELDAWFV